MGVPFVLGIDGKVGDIFQVIEIIGKETGCSTILQIAAHQPFSILNLSTIPCIELLDFFSSLENGLVMEYFVDVMREIGQDINTALYIRKWVTNSFLLQNRGQPQRGKDTIEQMAHHRLVIFRFKRLLCLLFEQLLCQALSMITSFRRCIGIQFKEWLHHCCNKITCNDVTWGNLL